MNKKSAQRQKRRLMQLEIRPSNVARACDQRGLGNGNKNAQAGIVEALKKKYQAPLVEARRALKEDYVAGELKKGAVAALPLEPNRYLLQKWAHRVGNGWYGFSLSNIPGVWVYMLDDFLAWVESQCPDFEIHQIKTKFGGLRFYIDTHCRNTGVNTVVSTEITKLEKLMFHENLIYASLFCPIKPKERKPKQIRKRYCKTSH